MDESSATTEFVDQYYRMNPETEDVLFDGTYLRDGMRVLIEDPYKRANTPTKLFPSDDVLHELLVNNRWCVVSQAAITPGGHYVNFVGVYDDGTKTKRMNERSNAWIVKLDSIPPVVEQINELVDQHYEMDPMEDVILPDGTYLMDGMRVLVAAFNMRHPVHPGMKDAEIAKARVTNRWCKVTHLKTLYTNNSMSFIGEYDDGTKDQRVVTVSYSWLVKADTIPSPPPAKLSSYSDKRPA